MKIFANFFKRSNNEEQISRLKKIKFSNEDEYEGELVNEKREGQGTYKFQNGNRYEGQWKDNQKHGQGKFYYQNGELYIGSWRQNKKHGDGMYFYTNGERYIGKWKQNEKFGEGTIYYNDGSIFTGSFKNNQKQGVGYLYQARTKKILEVVYDEDQKIEEFEKTEIPQQLKKVMKHNYIQSRLNKMEISESNTDQEKDSVVVIQPPLIENNHQTSLKPEKGIDNSVIQDGVQNQDKNKKRDQKVKTPPQPNSAELRNQVLQRNLTDDSDDKIKGEKSLVSVDEPIYSQAQLQMGFETLQVMENMEKIKQNQKQQNNLQIQDWGVEEVIKWLESENLGQYAAKFRENLITGQNLLTLKDDELKDELQVSVLGHRKEILRQIGLYKHYYRRFLQSKFQSNRSQHQRISDSDPSKTPESKNFTSGLYSQDYRIANILKFMEKIEEEQEQSANSPPRSQTDKYQSDHSNIDDQDREDKEKKKKKAKKNDKNNEKNDMNTSSLDESGSSSSGESKLKKKKKKNKYDSLDYSKDKALDEDQKNQNAVSLLRKKSKARTKKQKDSTEIQKNQNNSFINGDELPLEENILLDLKRSETEPQAQVPQLIECNKILDQIDQAQEQLIKASVKLSPQNHNQASSHNTSKDQIVLKIKDDTEIAQDEVQFIENKPVQNLSVSPNRKQSQPKLSSSDDSDVSNQSSSESSDSEDKKSSRNTRKHNHRTKEQKEARLKTLMSMLKDVGINERVLIDFGELQLHRVIGEGGYGKVKVGRWLGQEVAVKIYGRRQLKGNFKSKLHLIDFLKEVEVISNLRHPNIVLYMGVCQKAFSSFFLVTEYLEQGSLFDHLHKKQTKFDNNRIFQIVEDIALGMNYLHGRKVLHCDLKSSNVLIDQNWNVKLCDFGLSRMKDNKKTGQAIGTPHWMAPEIMRGEPYNEAADVYSFGMILWELVSGQIPYEGLSITQILGTVGYGKDQVSIPQSGNESILQLIRMCLNREIERRPSFKDIVRKIQASKRGDEKIKSISNPYKSILIGQVIQSMIDFFE